MRRLLGALLLAALAVGLAGCAAAPAAPVLAKPSTQAAKAWTDIVDVIAVSDCTVALRGDGTVVFAGNDYNGAGKNISGWTDIERIELSGWTGWENYVIGYKKDGSIVLESLYDWQNSNAYGTHWVEQAFSSWKDIRQLTLSDDFCLGLHRDGTVSVYAAYTDDQQTLQPVSAWTDIRQLAADGFSLVVGLKNDGTIVSTDDNAVAAQGAYWGSTWGPQSGWKDIDQLVYTTAGLYAIKQDGTVLGMQRAGWQNIDSLYVASDSMFGLRRDGTVATDFSDYYSGDTRLQEIASWKNIVQLGFDVGWARYVPVGLCADGTIRAVTKGSYGEDYGYWDFSGWSDVKRLYSGSDYTIGLREDGTLLVTGGEFGAVGYLAELSGWKDIAAIYTARSDTGTDHIVGLKTDGTLVAAGNNSMGQCKVTG